MDATAWIVLGIVLIVLSVTILIVSCVFLHKWIKKFKEE